MNPDKPVGGDPPIDAMSMLEVIGDARASAEARMAAARDMMAPYAIRALLDGTDPRQVAEACGFRAGSSAPTRNPIVDAMQKQIEAAFGYRVIIDPDAAEQVESMYSWGGETPKDDLEAFFKWINSKFNELIRRNA